MKKILPAVWLFSIGFVLLACSSKPVNSSVNQPNSTNQSKPVNKPITVLVRHSDKDSCAADGLLYLAIIIALGNKAASEQKTDVTDATLLISGNGLTVENEFFDQEGKKDKKPGWKLDPQNFDFLVTWNNENKENSKKSMKEALTIATTESITVEKVSAPSVTKNWTFSYILNAGPKIDAYEKTAEEQINSVIVPARGAVLKEIRAFIASNMNQ